MFTEVYIQRPLLNGTVRQSSKTGFLNATELVNLGNQYRSQKGLPFFDLAAYWQLPSTKEFLAVTEANLQIPCKKVAKGRNGGTWVHPFIFVDIALALDPELKFEVYKWLSDELLKYRNDSGDSYKKMCGALWGITPNKKDFQKELYKVNSMIQKACGVRDWNCANESQLKLRNEIEKLVALLSDVLSRSTTALVSFAISKAKESLSY